jgi:nucleoside-diphosphate-sugar epimerase
MNNFNNKTILIVGGAGFIGSNLCLNLLRDKPKKIIIIDNLISSEANNIPNDPSISFIYGSINDYEILNMLEDNIDYVFNLVCYHGNQSSIINPLKDHLNNAFANLNLFNHLSKFKNIKKVVYAAAGCSVAKKTFEKAEATAEDSNITLYHDSPYSISKLIGELYGQYYHKITKFPFVTARFQNVYGPGEILGAGEWRGSINTIWRNVIPTFIWKALHNEPLPLENNGLGTRDFIFVDDICEGLLLCAIKGHPGDIYNLASGIETSILELAEIINKITNNNIPMLLLPPRNWDTSGRRFGSTIKSEKNLNFKAKIDIKDGIKRTIEWTKNNKDLIDKIIDKHKFLINKLDTN